MNFIISDNLPLLSLLALVILVVCAQLKRTSSRHVKRQQGLTHLLSLKNLLADIQQHRGLSTGFLHGSSELLAAINSQQNRINRSFQDATSEWFLNSERWQEMRAHWTRLRGNYQENNPDNNITQHNLLIRNLLYLIDDMAEEHDLGNYRANNGTALHYAWRELLIASECIGQARALGMAVASVNRCDTAARIRLNYLCNKIKSSTNTAFKNMRLQQQQKEPVNTLLDCINNELLKTKPAINASDYFQLATQALNTLHQQYDHIIDNCTEDKHRSDIKLTHSIP